MQSADRTSASAHLLARIRDSQPAGVGGISENGRVGGEKRRVQRSGRRHQQAVQWIGQGRSRDGAGIYGDADGQFGQP